MPNKISISKFKTHCLEMIEKLNTNNEPIIITKRDKPIAKVIPFNNLKKNSLFGILKDKAEIKGNIIEPIDIIWEANNNE